MTDYIKQNSLIVNTYFLLVLRFVFQEHGDFTWKVSDCEESVGVTHRRWWDWGEDKRHGFGSLAILDAQEIRKEERRSIENMMSRCFILFPHTI